MKLNLPSRRNLFFILAIAFACALAGCANPLVGTWQPVSGGRLNPKNQTTTTFGWTGAVTVGGVGTTEQTTGTYSIQDDRVTIVADHFTQTYRYRIAGNLLRLENDGSRTSGKTIVFRRTSPAAF